MRKITISLCCIFSSLLAFSQEKAFEDKINAFTQQQKPNIYAFSKIEDATTVDELKTHPFIKAFKQFTKENSYASIRKERYAQYAPPPAGLQHLKWQTGGDWGTSLDLLSVVFIRSFEPGFPSQFMYNIVIPRIASITAAPSAEVVALYNAKSGYGTLLYTTAVSDSVYQVWAANRIFAVTYKMNIYTGTPDDIKFTLPKDPAYAKIQWTPHVIKPMDEITKLQGDIDRAIWNKTTTITGFYTKNIHRFKQVREEKLKPYIKDYTPAKTGYRELEEVPERIKQDTMTRTRMYPQQWESTIQSASLQGDNAEEMAKRFQLNEIFGSARYVKQVDKDNWEVWVVNEADRIHYIWNTYTGQIDKVHYWIKE